jgi:signal transduction histidine kinase
MVFADRMTAVGTLAAGVAHEINNPLTFIAANVDMSLEELRALSRGSSSSRMNTMEEMLVDAREGVARVAKIVRGLKTFSRLERERRTTIDLLPVIELAVKMTFEEIRHRARLVKEYGPLPPVEADDARLGQVFINLLVNAAHAFPDGKTDANEIRIVTSTDAGGRAVVEVRDSGSGIPAAVLDRIFEPFFTTRAVGVGAGLGLAISYNIVTEMGGQIAVQSELGQGATFQVVLPPSKSAPRFVPVENGHSKSRPVRPATLLVVDDEPA